MKHKFQLLHTPDGVRDIYNGECERKELLLGELKKTIKSYGFKSIETPGFEFFDIFSEERGTIAAKEMYKFVDREGEILVLRPDMTPSIARCAAKYFKDEKLPLRLSYTGNAYINNSSHQGKLNELTQVGAELINDGSAAADSEILALTVDCLLKAGLKEFQVEVGHADFFNGLMEEAAFDDDEVMQMKSLMECKNIFGIGELISKKPLHADLKELLLKLPELFGSREHIAFARGKTKNEKALRALNRLEEILQLLEYYGKEEFITVDLGMLSKYDYYTGIIMKAYTYASGEPVAQGGRYDHLVGQFGKEAPAVGLAIVADQLLFSLSRQKLSREIPADGILILYDKERLKDAVEKASVLRLEGKKVSLAEKKADFSEADYQEFSMKMGIEKVMEL